MASVLAALVVVAGCGDNTPPAEVLFAASASGYGAFESLLGVGAVVNATVVGSRGPSIVEYGNGAIDIVGRSEDASEWTTPLGLPVIVLDDLELVTAIDGMERADVVAASVSQAIASAATIEVLAPVGVYDEMERYEFWLSRNRDVGQLTYLAFDMSGQTIDGLGVSGLDDAFDELARHTGTGRIETLAAMAQELNASADDGAQGELMDFVYGPQSFRPANSDVSSEISSDAASVQVSVTVVGATPGSYYSLLGLRPSPRSATDDDGQSGLQGNAYPGDELELLWSPRGTGDLEPVVGAPTLVIEDMSGEFLAVYDLDDGSEITLRAGLSLPELDTLIRADLGLPPETSG